MVVILAYFDVKVLIFDNFMASNHEYTRYQVIDLSLNLIFYFYLFKDLIVLLTLHFKALFLINTFFQKTFVDNFYSNFSSVFKG